MASHTGSGKTLAYLLPIVAQLRHQEDALGFVSRPRRPRVVVLPPTRELADQIGAVAKHLSHFCHYRTAVLSAGVKCALFHSRRMPPGACCAQRKKLRAAPQAEPAQAGRQPPRGRRRGHAHQLPHPDARRQRVHR